MSNEKIRYRPIHALGAWRANLDEACDLAVSLSMLIILRYVLFHCQCMGILHTRILEGIFNELVQTTYVRGFL